MNKLRISLILFGLGILIFWFFAFPIYSGFGNNVLNIKSVKELYIEKLVLDKELESAKELLSIAIQTRKNFDNLDKNVVENIFNFLLKEREIPELYNDINNLVMKSNLELRSISHTVKENKDLGENIKVIEFNITVAGSYENMLSLLSLMQESKPIYKIKNMNFDYSNQLTKVDSNKDNKPLFNITFEMYELKQ